MKKLLFLLLVTGLMGCNGGGVSKDQLKKMLQDNPEILTAAIEAHPVEVLESFQKAVKSAQGEMAKKRAAEEKKKFEESFNNPLKPELRSTEYFKGPKNAPITLIEYSDFECPYCSRGYQTYKSFMNKYKGKVRFVFKHLPLSFHKHAMIAAQYMEASRLQDPKKSWKFHDAIFENQQGLKSGGEDFLKATAKKLGLNVKKLAADIHSPTVKSRISQDMAEAQKFGIQGTPGFVLNGIPIKGAYPLDYFVKIIDTLKQKGKLKL